MSKSQDHWDDCYALAQWLKQKSLQDAIPPLESPEDRAVRVTQEAIADLQRRADSLRQRYQ